jgi:6-phosphogluconate dehydrogenase
MSADIGLIGLAVMGENLILNMESKGFTVAAFNRTTTKVDEFLEGRAKGKKIIGTKSIPDFVKALKKPRKVMIMVRAGSPVDDTIKGLLPYLEKGDIIVDGGNSNYEDTNRRIKELEPQGFNFFGAGVSGGEEGALKGPSIMPGGSKAAWEHLKPIFQTISAKVEDGSPCCDYVGPAGSGHFVKMVHNGIEYGDMQLISEAYYLMKKHLGLNNQEIADTFEEWNKGDLDSYLIEITRDIFRKKDEESGEYVLDLIVDAAGQKGTGKWTVVNGLDLGAPVTLIGEAVFARTLSSQKDQRVIASKILKGPPAVAFTGDRKQFLNDIRDSIYASKIVSYAQGYVLMAQAAKEFKWELNYGGIALMWRGGCIIRSKFLGKIKEAFDKNRNLENLLLDDFFTQKISNAQAGWRRVAAAAVMNGYPIPALSTALAYFDGVRQANLPANLIQAQRDYFGAHTYERVDKPRGQFFHTNWTGHGGTTSSTTYNV